MIRKWYWIAVILWTGALAAKQPSDFQGLEDRVKRLEQDSGLDIRPETTTFFLWGQGIYWKTSVDGVAYATTAQVDRDPAGNSIYNKYKARTVHFDYAPAFQIGLGVGLPYDHWNVTLSWLRSFTKGTDRAHGDGDRVILDSVGMIEELSMPFSRAKADCHVHLDVVDLVLGRDFLWSRYFWFRPYVGVRGARLKLDWDIAMTRPFMVKLDVDNHYYAGGFVGGFESKWNVWRQFGLFSHASAALIYGKSAERTVQKNSTGLALKARNATHVVKAVFDIALGVKWEMDFFKRNHLLIWLGYDFFYWPNATQKTIIQDGRIRDRSDLSFEGVIGGAKVAL